MTKLSRDQKAFLSQHNIKESEVLDAAGMRTMDYKALMSEQGYRVAIGVTACKRSGHTMRGANGHCVMCKPANLNYRKRFREAGYVYVATTEERSDIIKIGYCENIKNREATLNASRYGGYQNWRIQSSRKAEQKGPLEQAIHKRLEKYSFSSRYFHDNQEQMAIELFQYDLDKAIGLLQDTKINSNDLDAVKAAKKTSKRNISPSKEPKPNKKIEWQHHKENMVLRQEVTATLQRNSLTKVQSDKKNTEGVSALKNLPNQARNRTSSTNNDKKSEGLSWDHSFLIFLLVVSLIKALAQLSN